MPLEPAIKRAETFFDGQNLFHAARMAFARQDPDYDVGKLSKAVCQRHGWQLKQVHLYTGIPGEREDPFWSRFWRTKLLRCSLEGIDVFSRPLRYRDKRIKLPDGSEHVMRVGEEKGIDVRLALDVVRGAYHRRYDVAVLFSQDQDLSEVAREIRAIAREQDRWIKIASAFPVSATSRDSRGIDKTDWVPIDRETYDRCRDP